MFMGERKEKQNGEEVFEGMEGKRKVMVEIKEIVEK